MSSYTPVHNRFWSDGWVRQLNALDRYLFLYLLTNGRARLTGIYELPLDLMASECGIDERDLKATMLARLEPKIYYREGWVIITNYLRHHIGGGHKFGAGVRANFEELPPKIRDIAKGYGYPIDTLSVEYQRFPNRIEYNRKEKPIAKPIASSKRSLEPLTEVRTTNEGEEKQPKKRAPRDLRVWTLQQKLYDILEKDNGVRPTPHWGDYQRIAAALVLLKESDIISMVEDAIAIKTVHTVREVLTTRQIDIYRQENV